MDGQGYNRGDPLYLPLGIILYHYGFTGGSSTEFHTGDPSGCSYPCIYRNPAKNAIAGYNATESVSFTHSLSINSLALSGTYWLRSGGSTSWNKDLSVGQSFSWSSPAYQVYEYNQELNCDGGFEDPYDTIDIPSTEGNFTENAFPYGGRGSVSIGFTINSDWTGLMVNSISITAHIDQVYRSPNIGVGFSAYLYQPTAITPGTPVTLSVPAQKNLGWGEYEDLPDIEVTIG